MTAKDLMLGDWVEINVGPFCNRTRVTAISGSGGINPVWNNGELVWQYDIMPIDLTEKILKRNGFRPDLSNNKDKLFSLRKPDRLPLYVWMDKDGFYVLMCGQFVRVDYVHQFQHVLKMSGSEKEVTL